MTPTKNPLLARVIGESSGDVAPVIANLPRTGYRDRLARLRQRRDPEGLENPDKAGDKDAVKESRRDVARLIGEATDLDNVETGGGKDEDLFPENAKEMDDASALVGKPLRQPKKVVQEPSHPTADKEKYLTPASALTAPDATPQATQPLDPSQVPVPGGQGPLKFTAADLEKSPAATAEGGTPLETPDNLSPGIGVDPYVKTMDVLLGRTRAPKPPTRPEEMAQAGAISTEEAMRMMGVQDPIVEGEAKAKAASVLTPGTSGMPAPAAPSDGAAVAAAFRRFNG